MSKGILFTFCAAAILSLSAGPMLAGTATLPSKAASNYSPAVQLVQNCKPDGKSCKRNDQCCSGNCQKGTGMTKGTCLHGD